MNSTIVVRDFTLALLNLGYNNVALSTSEHREFIVRVLKFQGKHLHRKNRNLMRGI